VRIKGKESLYNIRTSQSGRIFCSPCCNKCLPLVSEKFVLASESNLSLAAGVSS